MSFKQFYTSLLIFLTSAAFAQEPENKISIIPEPVEIVRAEGFFVLPEEITIKSATSPEILGTVNLLKKRLVTTIGTKVNLSHKDEQAVIKFQLNNEAEAALGKEGYRLVINQKQILIKANQPAGLFYGVQSLLQLFPKEIESAKQLKADGVFHVCRLPTFPGLPGVD